MRKGAARRVVPRSAVVVSVSWERDGGVLFLKGGCTVTRDECREYLPEGWLPLIEADPVLKEIFEEHDYHLEQDAVPPFLIQELRGGNLERLRPILALYGQPGLSMLEGLLEIDEAAKETAEITLPNGQTAYAGYFFASASKESQERAVKTAKRYLRAICRIYEEVFREPSPVEPKGGVLLLTGQEARDMREKIHQAYVHGKPYLPDLQIRDEVGDWFSDLPCRGDCGELEELLHEALYHINNDYFLSYYLLWPLTEHPEMENPFRPHFELWKMGWSPQFFDRSQMALIDC